MATVQKSSKLNFYKFVQVKEPSSSSSAAVGSNNSAVATKAINNNTVAINNLGSTVNSIGKILVDIKKVSLAQLEIDKKDAKKFEAQYTKPQKQRKGKGLLSALENAKVPGFLENLLNLFGGLFKLAILRPALKWLADPKNRESVKTIINVIKTVVGFIFEAAKFGIVNTIEGLYKLLSDETSWWDKLIGLGQAIAGIGTILLGVRYLKNPTKIITDIYRGVKALIGFVTGGGRRGGGNLPRGSKRRRFGGAARFLLGTGVAVGTGYALTQMGNEPPEQMAKGGQLKKAAQGGWISGPQSGYKVSLDGGRSTSFIGHGTEYVARKSNGGAFVVPFNTPGTKTQPHLTQKRLGEAKSLGYNVPGYAQGGLVGGKPGRPADPKNRKIFFHWSGGFHNSTGGLPYHQTFSGAGKPNSNNVNYGSDKGAHTAGHNTNSVALGAAAMGHQGMSKNYYSDKKGWQENPLTNAQTTAMAKEAAALMQAYGQTAADIKRNVWTHGEWERYAVKTGKLPSPVQRWDLDSLTPGPYNHPGGFWSTKKVRSQGGDQMRAKVARFMTGAKVPTQDPDESGNNPASGNRGIMSNFLGAIDAMTGNRTDFDGMGNGQSGPQPAPSSSSEPKRQVGKADPGVKVEPLPENFSDKQAFMHIYNIARKVGGTKWPEIVAAQAMHETGYLKAKPSVYFATGKTNPFGQTGDRGYGTIVRKGYKDGWTKYPNLEVAVRDHIKMWHDVNNHPENYNAYDTILDGIAAVAPAYSPNSDPANIRLGYTTDKYSAGMVRALKVGGFDVKAKRTGDPPEMTGGGDSTPPPASGDNTSGDGNVRGNAGKKGLFADFLGPRGDARSGEEIYGTDMYSDAPISPDTRERQQRQPVLDLLLNTVRQSNQNTSKNQQTLLSVLASDKQKDAILSDMTKITKDRNKARQVINNRTQQVMAEVTNTITQSNLSNATAVQMAQQMIAQLAAQSNQAPPAPQFIPTGGGGSVGGGGGGGGISGAGIGRAIGGDTGAAIGGITAAALNSFNNPLKGIFR